MVTGTGKQHVEEHRKLLLRRALMRFVPGLSGAAYVPFIGDGDIASELYRDLDIWGADLEEARVANAAENLPGAHLVAADCDAWPFAEADPPPFALADFDAYSYPYASFRAFAANAQIQDKAVLFFTDGQRQPIHRNYTYVDPLGERHHLDGIVPMRRIYNAYWSKVVQPWWRATCLHLGWKPIVTRYYLRANTMLYWGAVVRRRT